MSFTYDSDYQPWVFRIDANLDGVFSISDIWTFLGQLFFLPGDSLTYLILNFLPGMATFLEYSHDDYHGFLSGVFSVVGWFVISVLVVLALAILDLPRQFYLHYNEGISRKREIRELRKVVDLRRSKGLDTKEFEEVLAEKVKELDPDYRRRKAERKAMGYDS